MMIGYDIFDRFTMEHFPLCQNIILTPSFFLLATVSIYLYIRMKKNTIKIRNSQNNNSKFIFILYIIFIFIYTPESCLENDSYKLQLVAKKTGTVRIKLTHFCNFSIV
jgi:hypothetical protein